MPKRVLVAGLFHETHTFLSGLTRLGDFIVQTGDKLLASESDVSPMAGVLQFACTAGWEIVPVVDMRAMPGPVVEDRVVETFWTEFRKAIASNTAVDGVLLVLHGAMVSESLDDVEGELLERVWQLYGRKGVPTCAVIDLHANFTAKMARYSHGFVAYRENPHTDARQAAIDAACLLDRLMQTGERPLVIWHHPPVMWPPTGTATACDPMRSLEQAAREIERSIPSILAVNVLAGFAFADTPDGGASFCAVTTGDPEQARRELEQLGRMAVESRELGNVLDPPASEVVRRLVGRSDGPIILAEPADNIGAGASGAGTGLLRVLVEHSVDNAVVTINDPESVRAVSTMRPGERRTVRIGAKNGPLDSEPLELEVELISTSDGKFELEDPQSHLASMFGSRIDMGPCAVVRHRGIRILLTSRKTPPFDLGQLRSQGIEPRDAFVIGVKAAVAHRRAYDPIARGSYTVDTPGPCSSNLKAFPYRKVRRPIHPLDE